MVFQPIHRNQNCFQLFLPLWKQDALLSTINIVQQYEEIPSTQSALCIKMYFPGLIPYIFLFF